MFGHCQKYSCPDPVNNKSAIGALSCIGYDDLKLWILVEQLLYPAIVRPLLLKKTLTLAL